MKEKLKLLERQLEGITQYSSFAKSQLEIYPDYFKEIHSYKIFGRDILAIPANLIIEGDDDEFEIPFRFTDNLKEIEIFEIEYRPYIPQNFVQIGSLYGNSEIVLLNVSNENIHVFHISDVADIDWLKYKLENEVCSFYFLIEKIKQQTVCCLINSDSQTIWKIIEIRNNVELKCDDKIIKFDKPEKAFAEYILYINGSIKDGYKVNYCPKNIVTELERNTYLR